MTELAPRCARLMLSGNECGRKLRHHGRCQKARKKSQRYWHAERRSWWRAWLDEYKTSRGCAQCGFQNERGGYFDLDHLDRSSGKNTAVTVWCRKLNPKREDHMQKVLDELAKCQVLCVACHREKTSQDLASDW